MCFIRCRVIEMPAAKISPFMAQYQEVKSRYAEELVLFRMGDFYETFNEDAVKASKILGITLTARDSRSDHPTPMAGIPHHALKDYLPRLIKQGIRVAICDQMENPAEAKGIVKREVTRVVTRGTLTEDAMLEPGKSNYLMCLSDEGELVNVAAIDFSTGEIFVRELPRVRVLDFLESLRPDELVISRTFQLSPLGKQLSALSLQMSPIDDWNFGLKAGYDQVLRVYHIHNVEGLGLSEDSPFLKPLGALLKYLEQTQISHEFHLRKLSTLNAESTMILDSQTCRNLEIFSNQRDGTSSGTLYECMNDTTTPMGSRKLASWLAQPLLDAAELELRFDRVQAFAEYRELESFREILGGLRDLERPLGRVRCGRYGSRDLQSIASSLGTVPKINEHLRGQTVLESLRPVELVELQSQIESTLNDDLPQGLQEGGMIREGVDAELDELRAISAGGHRYLNEMESRLRTELELSGLKVRQNKVFGFYIELPKAQSQRAPDTFIRRQTLVNAERYIIPELKEYEDKIYGAQEKIVAIELRIVCGLRDRVLEKSEAIMDVARRLAEIDVLSTFGWNSVRNGYVRPVIEKSPCMILEASRHPVVEKIMGFGAFLPNNIHLSGDGCRVMLLTGPNMSGKSTYIRQIGLHQLMCQVGSFVPARSARMSLADRIFTRVGAGDDLNSGRSTFMVEMNETANILHNATPRSLVILDEVGRGTSTSDGLSLAWAITEELHDNKSLRPLTLFATHYHELTALSDRLEHARNFQVAVDEREGEIVFLHHIEPGFADRSYGIHVAKLAGLPEKVIKRAWKILEKLENERKVSESIKGLPAVVNQSEPAPLFVMPASDSLIEKQLRELDLDGMTPIEAMLALRDMKNRLP